MEQKEIEFQYAKIWVKKTPEASNIINQNIFLRSSFFFSAGFVVLNKRNTDQMVRFDMIFTFHFLSLQTYANVERV